MARIKKCICQHCKKEINHNDDKFDFQIKSTGLSNYDQMNAVSSKYFTICSKCYKEFIKWMEGNIHGSN